MDYFDILLAKKLNGSGGDITIEDLTINANGEYRAPSGKAYGKVTANVPAPSNALFKQTLTGLPSPIATFTGADAPIDSLKASIVGVQSGSGDPSPSNVRPVSGWSGANVWNHGKNWFDTSKTEIGTAWNGGSNSARARLIIPCKPNTTYTYSRSGNLTVTNIYVNSFASIPAESAGAEYTSYTSKTFTTRNTDKYIIFAFSQTAITQSDIDSMDIQLELGETTTTYEPYDGNTYTIPFKDSIDNPITVYGGVIDVTGGKLTVTHANIASYNGETINEPWISSEDIYTQGATPTTGAQVVYPLTTPLVYDFDPLALRSNGVTNISVDCGEVTECKYYSETP